MAEVVPFNGILYNVSGFSKGTGEDLLAPPYDIITPEFHEELYRRSPYNVVRIDYGKELSGDDEKTNKYARAKDFLSSWLREGVLVAGKEPCFYSYEISYTMNNVVSRLRGFLGLVRLEELGKGNIHPHECTHSKPKKDRLELMRSCEGNISPIFSLYSSAEKKASGILEAANQGRPYLEAKDINGSVHRLWTISDRSAVSTIRAEMEGKPIFIADGHHRYETALEYQREMREKEGAAGEPRPYDYVLMFLANMQDEGLTILPTHRLVKKVTDDLLDRLSTYFTVEKIPDHVFVTEAIAGKRHAFGLYRSGGRDFYQLTAKEMDLSHLNPVLADLDVSILHEFILGKLLKGAEVAYEMDIERCLTLVNERQFEAAFFLNPTEVGDVEKVALASLRMPPKSTFFYPKLMTGMVLNIFRNSF